jgi:D-sedoheptulose 7-phosphate isomerase
MSECHLCANPATAYLERVLAEARRVNVADIEALIAAITAAYEADATVFIIGNGGSGANASHLCEDLGKGTLTDFETQKRLRVISLTDNTPYILAWGNDTDFSRVFVEQLKNLARPGDLLIAISGSGNSPNVLRAVEYANAHGLVTFGVTGFEGGTLRDIAHNTFHVPCLDMGIAEAVHGIYFHYLVDALRERFAEVR